LDEEARPRPLGRLLRWHLHVGQSFEKKYAYAGAFAQVVEDAGFRAYADEWIN
jgi:hypothetical protein